MLSLLTIKNILLIDSVELEFKKGLNTLTGETGVGKSVILDCLGFVLGWNNSSRLVRDGAKVGEVIAEFTMIFIDDLSLILDEVGLGQSQSDTIILRRVATKSDGRKRNFINDKNVSLDLMKRVSKRLVELQDQTGNQILLNETSHLKFLDRYAGLSSIILEIQSLWKEKKFLEKKLEVEIAGKDSVKSEKAYLESAIKEISDFDVQFDEEAKLDSERQELKVIKKNKEKFEKIDNLIRSSELENNILEIIKLLDSMSASTGTKVEPSITALDQTLNDFTSARSAIWKLLESQNFDANEFETIEDRLFTLRSLGRKYNVPTSELPNLLENMSNKLRGLNSNQNDISVLQDSLKRVTNDYQGKANILSSERIKAAKDLDSLVIKELNYLKMADCLFHTDVSSSKASSSGIDNVIFKVITNRGGKFGKLQEISSGGEMSRFLLALKVCLTDQEQGTTMIFDEIDRGIGGSTADAVGRRLSMLAKRSQIIVVTHSPQVAAHGDYQWKVEKLVSKDSLPITRIKELSRQDRLTEIARMLSGKEISKEALAAAKKLLDQQKF